MNQLEFKKSSANIHKEIGTCIYFHDRLNERWRKEVEFDVVTKRFVNAPSKTMAHEAAKRCRETFIIFDKIHVIDETRLNVFVYDGNFLLPSFRHELTQVAMELVPLVYSINASTLSSTCINPNCHARSVTVKMASNHKSIIYLMYDFDVKFGYLNTVGGLIVNRHIERNKNKRLYQEDVHSAFSFFMGLFCQSFKKEKVFFPSDISLSEMSNQIGSIEYELRHDVCGDGSVRSTISYDCFRYDSMTYLPKEAMTIEGVYRSLNVDIDIDMDVDSNGYYPIWCKKEVYQEFVSYDKTDGKDTYGDRSLKHLYEEHHHFQCKGKHGYCKSKLFRTNYKKDDVFQVENEESHATI